MAIELSEAARDARREYWRSYYQRTKETRKTKREDAIRQYWERKAERNKSGIESLGDTQN